MRRYCVVAFLLAPFYLVLPIIIRVDGGVGANSVRRTLESRAIITVLHPLLASDPRTRIGAS